MVIQFKKSIVWTLILYICIGVVYQTDLPATDHIRQYLDFVLTTDFDSEFFQQPYYQFRAFIDEYDFSMLLQGLPRIATGW